MATLTHNREAVLKEDGDAILAEDGGRLLLWLTEPRIMLDGEQPYSWLRAEDGDDLELEPSPHVDATIH